jgi:uncharacterized protein YwgA
MMSNRTQFEQLRDQAGLLYLLNRLKEFGFQTQRLKLQKLVYLADIFGTMIGKKPTGYVFKVYKLGPYSKEIQSDIERLASIDAVEVKEIGQWDPNQERSFEYEIEEARTKKASIMEKTPDFDVLAKTVEFAVQSVGYLSGEEIRKLVYSEPNYADAKRKGFETTINPEYPFAVRFKAMSKQISLREFGTELREEEILWLYLNVIKAMQARDFTYKNEQR